MNKLFLQKIGILILLVSLCCCFGYFISIQPKKPYNNSSLFYEYDKYLKITDKDVSKLEVYVEPVTKYQEYDYYITVCNTSESFVCATLQLLTAKDNVCYETRFINLKPYEEKVIAINVDVVPTDYRWKKVSFYEYTYPEVELDSSITYDFDESYGYHWMNVVTKDAIDVNTCMEYVTYMYIQDILAGTQPKDIFFYKSSDVVYEYKGSQGYPDINSSYMGSAFDYEKIQIVDIKSGKILLEKLLK